MYRMIDKLSLHDFEKKYRRRTAEDVALLDFNAFIDLSEDTKTRLTNVSKEERAALIESLERELTMEEEQVRTRMYSLRREINVLDYLKR